VTGFLRKSLQVLFKEIPVKVLHPETVPAVAVTGIVFDSRQVQPGYVFIALTGDNTDGHGYIQAAVERGASAVVGSDVVHDLPVPYIRVTDTRQVLAYLSAAFYNFPARQLSVIGVTGTDGKTTTSNLIYEILVAAGCRVGIISTVNAVLGNEVVDTGFHVTTPEAPDVQRYLARMVNAGLTHVVLESTSHGLAQQRVTGCEFDIAVVTNITHEHLDYHGTYEAYREAKGRLFTGLAETGEKRHGNPRLAVLNRDDQSYSYLQSISSTALVSYSLKPGADLWAENLQHDPAGLHFIANGAGFRFGVDSSLVGAFNASNILAAMSAAIFGLGISPEVVQRGVANLRGVPGRMENIDIGQNFIAMVDFAHTPNALRVALETVRKITTRKVIAVFGSAGLRDRAKRRMMAEVSTELADVSIFTAEDPRTEKLGEILAEMSTAAEAKAGVEGETFWRVPDRRAAIRKGVEMAEPGDVLILCGKGHEQSMCFGEIEYPWDERIALRAALAESLGLEGPEMPFLPDNPH
jgi:UDP-N-acetylmuramoyl-L-alanyl-D-glutamate--2,6-diaminopimelate ligase